MIDQLLRASLYAITLGLLIGHGSAGGDPCNEGLTACRSCRSRSTPLCENRFSALRREYEAEGECYSGPMTFYVGGTCAATITQEDREASGMYVDGIIYYDDDGSCEIDLSMQELRCTRQGLECTSTLHPPLPIDAGPVRVDAGTPDAADAGEMMDVSSPDAALWDASLDSTHDLGDASTVDTGADATEDAEMAPGDAARRDGGDVGDTGTGAVDAAGDN